MVKHTLQYEITCRADHNLQDIRAKIFPFKRRKVNAPEVAPSITLPIRRKERSLSSLVVNTPRVAAQPGLTGRRTKVTARRASSLRGLGPIIEEPRKEVNSGEDRVENYRRQVKEIYIKIDLWISITIYGENTVSSNNSCSE